jgi:hypothetical protein
VVVVVVVVIMMIIMMILAMMTTFMRRPLSAADLCLPVTHVRQPENLLMKDLEDDVAVMSVTMMMMMMTNHDEEAPCRQLTDSPVTHVRCVSRRTC